MPILGSFNSTANKDMMGKYGQMGIHLSTWVENIVGKGETAPYKQFLVFPPCFQKQFFVDALKRVSMELGVMEANSSKFHWRFLVFLCNAVLRPNVILRR